MYPDGKSGLSEVGWIRVCFVLFRESTGRNRAIRLDNEASGSVSKFENLEHRMTAKTTIRAAVKLTPKQNVTVQLLKKFGPVYCRYCDSNTPTFETLVKRWIVEVTSSSEYGKTYRLAEAKS
jgi:hypothetical protein